MVATSNRADEPNPKILFTATIAFDGMTWGDLRQFVEMAAKHGVKDEETVDLHYENDDYYSPLGLEVTFLGGK